MSEDKRKPWEQPNEFGELPGGLCCQRATGRYCYEHDPANYEHVPRKCAQCGLELDPDTGLCAYCETEAVRELGRKLREPTIRQPTQIRDILTGPPTLDDLAAAASICERLTVHLENELAVRDGKKLSWERKTTLKRKAYFLRHTIGVLKSFLIVLFLVHCSNEVTEEPDAAIEEPGSELITGYARTEEPDAAIREPEEPDAAIREPEEPDASTSKPEETDASTSKPEETDASTSKPEETDAETVEEPDAAIEEPEETDASIGEPDSGGACDLLGSWSITMLPSVFCFDPSNNTVALEITDCDQAPVLPIETSNPSYGDFSGSITFHVTRVGDSLTGSADIEGTVHVYGQDMPCTSVATISGGRDETRESS